MSVRVEFRWGEGLLAAVDGVRGDVPRSVWVRRAVERALEHEASRVRAEAAARAIVANPEPYSASTVGTAERALRDAKERLTNEQAGSGSVPFSEGVRPAAPAEQSESILGQVRSIGSDRARWLRDDTPEQPPVDTHHESPSGSPAVPAGDSSRGADRPAAVHLPSCRCPVCG